MFTGNVMLMPGQELLQFDFLRPETRETARGQEVIAGYALIGAVKAILAQAKPAEIERWRQINHTITHKIIMRHKPPFDIRSGDIFERAGRRFYMQAMPHNPGDLGHCTIFYCDERNDTQ